MSVNSSYSLAFKLNVSHKKGGIMELLLECKQSNFFYQTEKVDQDTTCVLW